MHTVPRLVRIPLVVVGMAPVVLVAVLMLLVLLVVVRPPITVLLMAIIIVKGWGLDIRFKGGRLPILTPTLLLPGVLSLMLSWWKGGLLAPLLILKTLLDICSKGRFRSGLAHPDVLIMQGLILGELRGRLEILKIVLGQFEHRIPHNVLISREKTC